MSQEKSSSVKIVVPWRRWKHWKTKKNQAMTKLKRYFGACSRFRHFLFLILFSSSEKKRQWMQSIRSSFRSLHSSSEAFVSHHLILCCTRWVFLLFARSVVCHSRVLWLLICQKRQCKTWNETDNYTRRRMLRNNDDFLIDSLSVHSFISSLRFFRFCSVASRVCSFEIRSFTTSDDNRCPHHIDKMPLFFFSWNRWNFLNRSKEMCVHGNRKESSLVRFVCSFISSFYSQSIHFNSVWSTQFETSKTSKWHEWKLRKQQNSIFIIFDFFFIRLFVTWIMEEYPQSRYWRNCVIALNESKETHIHTWAGAYVDKSLLSPLPLSVRRVKCWK